jgi:hypothetical protein
MASFMPIPQHGEGGGKSMYRQSREILERQSQRPHPVTCGEVSTMGRWASHGRLTGTDTSMSEQLADLRSQDMRPPAEPYGPISGRSTQPPARTSCTSGGKRAPMASLYHLASSHFGADRPLRLARAQTWSRHGADYRAYRHVGSERDAREPARSSTRKTLSQATIG